MGSISMISAQLLAFIEAQSIAPNAQITFLKKLCTFQMDSDDVVEVSGKELNEADNHNKYYESSLEWFDDNHSDLLKWFIDEGFEYLPRIEKLWSKGGRSRKAFYKLQSTPITSKQRESVLTPHKFPVPEGGMRYTFEKTAPSWWFKNGDISLNGYRKWVFLSLALSPVFLILLGLLGYLFNSLTLLILATVLISLLPISLPLFMMLRDGYYLRILKDSSIIFIGDDDKGDRSIKFQTIKGFCPICQGDLFFGDQGLPLPFTKKKLIATCKNNTSLHRFSVDHVTHIGIPIGAYTN